MTVRWCGLHGFVLAFALACGSPPAGWDVEELEDRHPAVDEVDDHRLEEALPYFALGDDGLALFLCRWPSETPIPVWLPPQASDDQAAVLERAVAAWQGAGLGIEFAVDRWQETPPLAGIVVELVDPNPDAAGDAANTIADCAVPQQVSRPSEDTPGAPVDAVLQYASIHLSSKREDLLGRQQQLSSTELLGAAVHELGHALGFAGHVARGASVMSSHGQLDAVRRWGKRIERGEPLSAPTLAALYAAPSGAWVGWLPLERGQLDPVRAVAALATAVGMRGPWVRVGEVSSRMLWRDERARSAAVVVLDWPAVLHDPARFDARLTRRARMLVERAGAR